MYKIKNILKLARTADEKVQVRINDILVTLKQKFISLKRDFDFSFKINNEHVTFDIHSSDDTATDLLVQFDKQVREVLGKEFKNGVKESRIEDYELTIDVEELPKKPVTIPFVTKIETHGNQLKLLYKEIAFEYIKDHYIEKSIKLLKDKIKNLNYEGKDEFKEYVWEGKSRNTTYQGDPAVDLEKMNWIRRTESKGQFIYGREFTALVNVLKELYIKEIYIKLGFYEMIFPKFEPWEVPKKSGHAKNIYPSAYFVSVPKNAAPEYWQEVMDLYQITGEIQKDLIMQKTNCIGIMSYAQCPPFWPYLKNRVIDDKSLPILVYDWSGPTYRNESGGTHGLDRIEEFNRIETLFVGRKEQVVQSWNDLKEAFTHFYDKVLDIEIRVAKVTPWWMAHAGINAESKNPDVGTYDFDAYLPYRGEKDKEWLEIQNVSSNGDKYPVAFGVKNREQDYLWSGCAGASFQRVVVAFLAQKGLDPANWPKTVSKPFLEKTKGIKELNFF